MGAAGLDVILHVHVLQHLAMFGVGHDLKGDLEALDQHLAGVHLHAAPA